MEPEENIKKSKNEELIIEAKNFFESYKKEVGESLRKGSNVIYVNFMALSEFSNKLADEILSHPEETLRLIEIAIEESGLVNNVRVRLTNLSKTQELQVRNIRSKHLNELIVIEGIIRQASDVRPQVVNAKFECPSCGTIISVLQMEKKFREPTRCSCGRRGGFKLISKEMVDTQRLVIEEGPESLTGGEQPKRINIFVKEDLVEPKMEEKTTPGSRIKIIGILKEVPVPLHSGGLSTRFELAVEANNIIPLEETFEELDISEDDETQILELSKDPKIFEKLATSITPSVWGYEEIKRSLVLQLFSGVKKVHADGQKSRGDMHILLIGDPGVAKSISKKGKILFKNKTETGYEEIQKLYLKFGKFPENLQTLTINMKTHKPEWQNVKEIIKHSPEKELIKITTEHGKQITATKNHSFITLSKKGEIISIKGDQLTENSYLPIPTHFHKQEIKKINSKEFNTYKTNSKQIPNSIKLDNDFGFFIGIFLSEGCIKAKKSINISNQNKKIKEKTSKFAKKIKMLSKINKEEIIINSTSLSNLLRHHCYEDKKIISKRKGNYSRIKKIPDFSYFAPKEFIKGLISGIFSGDGRFIKGKKRIKGFELITVSEKLAQGTSDILFSVGILNKIKESTYKYKNKKTNYYKVSINSQMIKKFRKNFNFYGREYLSYPKPIYSYYNNIPCGDLVYELTKKLGYNKRIKGDRTFAAEMRTVKKRGKIGRIRLRNIIKKFEQQTKEKIKELEILKKIAYSPIIWSKIKEIKRLRKKDQYVYDLNIPKTNTFVANGIGVHNSVTLDFMAKISPKGRYVVGKSASGAGLTATVVRDEYLRGWSLEAGAMVLANKGLVCIDELEKMDPNDRSSMHEAMEQQCMLPNFELMLSNGEEIQIGKLVDNLIEKNKSQVYKGKNCEILPTNSIELISTDFENSFPIKAQRVSRHIAPKEFIKINLTNGREIIVTPEHPCWVTKEGKIITISAEKLQKNMFFPIPSKLDINSKNYKEKNNHLCKILGYHISDGCYELNRGKKTGIQFWNNNENLIKDYKNSIEKYFKIIPIITKRKNQFAVRVISKKIVKEILKLDKDLLEKGEIKKIPYKIMQLPKENIKYLLRTLYDGDGSVILQKRGGCRISFVSQNKKLEEQMSNLLLRFGIQSSIFEDKHSKVWRLDISGQENLSKFFINIGFLSEKKQQRLKKYYEKKKTYKTIKDISPNCTDKIYQIYQKLKIPQKKELGHKIDLNVHKQRLFLQKLIIIAEKYLKNNLTERKITKKNHNKILKDLIELKKIAFGFARWSKIKSIQRIKNKDIKWVYDVTIEPYHTFISNNMILHNTITISKANVQACYSKDTEVLTEKGWKNYEEVKNLKIAQYNSENNKINFLNHKGLYTYDYKGKMYNFKNKRNDILVTPNHTMLIKKEKKNTFEKINAEDIKSYRIKVLNSGKLDGKNQKYFILPSIQHKQNRIHKKYTHQHTDKKIPMDLWLEFLGYYVTEGGIETIPTIGIVQKKGKNANKIKRCLKKLTNVLGCSLSEIDCGKYTRLKITQTQLYEYLKHLGNKSYKKHLSLNFSEFSKNQLKILYDSMMLGDGASSGKDFGSTSKELINEMQAISCLIGKSTCQSIQYKEGTRGKRKTMYRISLCDKTELLIKKPSIKKINYNGKVWCFSTDTGFFITRRNGKIAIQGNTLRAETSVLAAANPKFGRFDPYQSIAQQIDLPPTLINRFDVIFTLRDIPQRDKDERIASHVLNEHQKAGQTMLIPRDLFRKYVAYAKQRIKPVLSEEAVHELKKFYVDLRNKPVSSESAMRPIPISARQLQALIRMSEASAKVRLSKVVARDDAKIAIDIMKYYLMQVGYDYESKTFDIDKATTGITSSDRNKIFTVRDTITQLESKLGKMIPIEELEKELEGKLSKEEIDEAITKLNSQGEIFKPRRGYVGKT